MAFQDYRWAAGNGVALASLDNFENDVRPNNTRRSGGKLYPVVVKSQPVDAFPVRTVPLSGEERGDGMINQAWEVVLGKFGLKYILDTYLSSGTVTFAAMTIYTRRHELDTFVRYNANLILPSVSGGDIEYLKQNAFRVRLRFRNLVAL